MMETIEQKIIPLTLIRNKNNGNCARVDSATWKEYVKRGMKDPDWEAVPEDATPAHFKGATKR